MANEEMQRIGSLDDGPYSDGQLLKENKAKIWFYFAEKDDWVGKEREAILRIMQDGTNEEQVKVVHGEDGVPHSFCISR
jgi:dienelactone hydrolase